MTTTRKRKPVKPLRGKALFRAAMRQIEAHPEQWDQNYSHSRTRGCRTTHCFMGWCQILAGIEESIGFECPGSVAPLLGISISTAIWLWGTVQTLPQLKAFGKEWLAGKRPDLKKCEAAK